MTAAPGESPGLADAAESAAVAFVLACQECVPAGCSNAQFFGAVLEALAGWGQRSDAKKDEWKRTGQAFLALRARGAGR